MTIANITAKVVPGPANTEWGTPNNGWRVTLKNERGNTYTVPFYTGVGIKGEPSAMDVMGCLVDDARGYRDASSFEDWAENYGYDPDSRAAEKIYRACKRVSDRLEKFLTDDEWDEFFHLED